MPFIRALLVEENRILRESLAMLFVNQPEMSFNTMGVGESLISEIKDVNPSVVLMDISLHRERSIQHISSIKQNCPDVKIIGMNLSPLETELVRFIQSGVNGFVLKDASFTELVEAIRVIINGSTFLPPGLAGSFIDQVATYNPQSTSAGTMTATKISKREKEIIGLIVAGMSNKEMADRLNISAFTVKSHLHRLMEKLGIHSRLELAAYANKHKIID
ncbi:MAG: response regulator transcription factor [candidate division Zixibacteria bacterium]|nr:response regulator transcription factor [candidate division Zixibacteria bacterium]